MATKINFTFKDVDYCLEFTRKAVRQLEARGVTPDAVLNSPMNMLPELFAGAFMAHHRFVDRKIVDEIYENMVDKKALIGTLAKMYNEPVEELFADAKEGNAIAWTTTE